MREGAADAAADAAEEEQVWGPGECHRHHWAKAGAQQAGPCSSEASSYPSRATSYGRCCCRITSRTENPAPGESSLTPQALVSATAPPCPALPCMAGSCFKPLSLIRASLQGLDQDWSAIAAIQCRLDKEGATKLVCDLITSTKNEKIFQESIGLAIRLLDGGNTEIQVGVRAGVLALRVLPAWEELWCCRQTMGDSTFRTYARVRGPVPALSRSCSPTSILSFQRPIFLAFSPL